MANRLEALPQGKLTDATSIGQNRHSQTPLDEFYGPYGAHQYMLHDPVGETSASVILLASWASKKGFWKWMFGEKFLMLCKGKPWRILEVIPRVISSGSGTGDSWNNGYSGWHNKRPRLGTGRGDGQGLSEGDSSYNGWYGYASDADWFNEVPVKEDLDAAVAYIHGIIQQELLIVKDYRRIILAGYSQGAVMALEAGFRFPHALGVVVSQRGILLDSRLHDTARLADTPYVLTCGSEDDVYTEQKIKHGASFLHGMGASAVMKTFPGLDHYRRSDQEVNFVLEAFSRALCQKCNQTLAQLENK